MSLLLSASLPSDVVLLSASLSSGVVLLSALLSSDVVLLSASLTSDVVLLSASLPRNVDYLFSASFARQQAMSFYFYQQFSFALGLIILKQSQYYNLIVNLPKYLYFYSYKSKFTAQVN